MPGARHTVRVGDHPPRRRGMPSGRDRDQAPIARSARKDRSDRRRSATRVGRGRWRAPATPLYLDAAGLEARGGSFDPVEEAHAAHESAAILVHRGRASTDPQLTARLVALAEEVGLDTLAHLWAARPPRSLPGALWRLYVLREWVRRDPAGASREYAAGMRYAAVSHVVAGAAEPRGRRSCAPCLTPCCRECSTVTLRSRSIGRPRSVGSSVRVAHRPRKEKWQRPGRRICSGRPRISRRPLARGGGTSWPDRVHGIPRGT